MFYKTSRKAVISIWVAFLLLMGISSESLAQNRTSNPVALTDSIGGQAWVERNGQRIKLSGQSPLFTDDIVITGKADRLQLVFTDGTTVALSEATSLGICSYSYSPNKIPELKLCLNNGAIRFISGKIAEYNLNGTVIESAQMLVVPHGGSLMLMDYGDGASTLAAAGYYNDHAIGFMNLYSGKWQEIKPSDSDFAVLIRSQEQKATRAMPSAHEISAHVREFLNRNDGKLELQRGTSCGRYLNRIRPRTGGIEQTRFSDQQEPELRPPVDPDPDPGPMPIPPIDPGPMPIPPPITTGPMPIRPVTTGPMPIPPIDPGPIQPPPVQSFSYSGKLTHEGTPGLQRGTFSFNTLLIGSSGLIRGAVLNMDMASDEHIKAVNGHGTVLKGNFDLNNFKIERAVNTSTNTDISNLVGGAQMTGSISPTFSSTSGNWTVKNTDGSIRHLGQFEGSKRPGTPR